MSEVARITVDPQVCAGRPIVAGTRMRVADVLSMLADGATRHEILADFPYLSEPDIAACLAYAAAAVDHRIIKTAA
jgi:uncharacterized protein (DUF433 family)